MHIYIYIYVNIRNLYFIRQKTARNIGVRAKRVPPVVDEGLLYHQIHVQKCIQIRKYINTIGDNKDSMKYT